MSALYRSGLPGPADATIARDPGWTGQADTSAFHGLSAGNTCNAAKTASARGSSNGIGSVTGGIAGRAGPAATSNAAVNTTAVVRMAARLTAAGRPVNRAGRYNPVMPFAARFAARLVPGPSVGLQLVFPVPLAATGIDPAALAAEVRAYHESLADAVVEFAAGPEVAGLVAGGGPPLSWAAVVSWDAHVIKVAGFDGPMPYGPVASCVAPALMPPEVKADAAAHQSHVLLDHAGPAADALARYTALACVAGALARFGATAVLNEAARTACPAFDLIPDDGEDALATLARLPLTYLFIGFVRTSVGGPAAPWVRTYGAHLFGLPDFAYQAAGPGAAPAGTVFAWFAALYGYLRETDATLRPGQAVNLDGATELTLSEPPDGSVLFDTDGTLLVVAARGG